MPEVVNSIYESDPNMHFHYITTTPQPSARKYLEFVLRYYPAGSFDFRPMNLTTLEQVWTTRKTNLLRLMESFPQRKFILVGDISNSDVVSGYADMANQYPDQVQCILMRNDSATDPTMAYPYSTDGYKTIPDSKYQFYRVPDDLAGIDFAHGGCRNYTFPQNVTFGEQLPSLHTISEGVFEGQAPLVALRKFFKALPSLF